MRKSTQKEITSQQEIKMTIYKVVYKFSKDKDVRTKYFANKEAAETFNEKLKTEMYAIGDEIIPLAYGPVMLTIQVVE